MSSEPAPAHEADLLPKDARLVAARSGELLRFAARTRPTVGRLWRAGEHFAFVDESDLVVADGADRWRYTVPLGAHAAVVLVGASELQRAERRDPGFAWELYEDALVEWGDSRATTPPPQPPSGAGAAAWTEAAGLAALLAEASSLDRGGRALRTALALEAVGRARPLVGPAYRADDDAVRAGRALSVKISGPRYVRVTARAAKPGPEPAGALITLDGTAVAGGGLSTGPRSAFDVPTMTGTPASWVLRVPAGKHTVAVTRTGAPVLLSVESFRKRVDLADGLSGDEDLEDRASPRSADPLVAAESLRLLGRLADARRAYAALDRRAATPPAQRVLAGWRLGELEGDRAAADAAFLRAFTAAAQLAPASRDVVLPALAAARLRRALRDGHAELAAEQVAAHPELWSDPLAAAALAGSDADRGQAVARLAAALAVAPLGAAPALRRAFYDRTVWTGAAPARPDDQLVLARDEGGVCADVALGPIGYRKIAGPPLRVDVPRDPLGSSRYLSARVAAFAPSGPSLDTVLLVDGQRVPLPVVAAAEEHRLAIAPGSHTIDKRGDAEIYISVPGDRAAPDAACDRERFRRRRYSVVPTTGTTWPVAAPAGGLVGLELRLLDPRHGQVVEGMLTVDGKQRRVVARSAGASVVASRRPVTPAVTIDLVAQTPASLALRRTDRGPGEWIARPLVRVTVASEEARFAQRLRDAALELLAAPAAPPEVPAPRDVRQLSLELTVARTPAERAKLHVARAAALAAMGRTVWADEDLRRAVALAPDAGYDRVLAATRPFVEPDAGAPAYNVDPTAPILHQLALDPAAARAAAALRAGELPRTRDDAALALLARLGDDQGDAAAAANAYAALAERHPDDPRLAVAEAARRLDRAAVADKSPRGEITRAYLAALRAAPSGTPGASSALARALDATRWRAVSHADASAGSIRAPQPAAPVDDSSRELRAALVAPELDPQDLAWLEPGQVLRAVFTARAPLRVSADARCAELRPAAAGARQASAPCKLALRVDGETRPFGTFNVAAGEHTVEVELGPGGLDAHAAVRLLTDRSLGAASRPAKGGLIELAANTPRPGAATTSRGGWILGASVEETRFLADPSDPVVVSVLGPTVLRLDVAAAAPVRVAELDGRELAALTPANGAARADVALPEARAYRVAIRPAEGRAAVAAAIREDRGTPSPRVAPVAEVAMLAPEAPEAGAAPRAPLTAVRFVRDEGDLGTLTVSEELRDGHVGDRDPGVERGGRWAETALSYRRRTGDVFWRADAFGRLRPEGSPSGGFGARALWRYKELRAGLGALGITQSTDTGTAITGWLDLTLALRHPLARDFFITPSVTLLVREGPDGDPGGDAVDPDVWSRFDVERPRQVAGTLRLDWEPFMDLHFRARGRAVAADGSLDRAGGLVGVSGAISRLAWGTSFELERRFAWGSRLFPLTQPIVRAGAAFSLWRGGSDRLSLTGGAALRPGERTEAYVGLSYDWTFGRGLGDFAPDEHEYSAQIGPYSYEER